MVRAATAPLGAAAVCVSSHHPMQPKNDSLSPRLQSALRSTDWSLLARLCRQALRKDPRHLMAHRLLGFALHRQRKHDAAFDAFRQGKALWPQDAELLINYANALLELARNQEAFPLLQKVVLLRPDQSVCWSKLAQSCYTMGLHQKGFEAARKALDCAQDTSQRIAALTQSAIHRRELGQIHEAVKDCEEAIQLSPYDLAGHTNRLLFMLADPGTTAYDIKAAAMAAGKVMEMLGGALQLPPVKEEDTPWKKLKIGFLSPDFRKHSVMYFVEDLLAQLDRRQFEVFAYYLYPSSDNVTDRVERHADHFVTLAGKTLGEQLQAVRGDGIDILIDLAGHTGNTGLPLMAQRAAPVQVTWLGYPGTTGVSAIDYRITDEVTDPPGSEDQYCEQLYRLPTLFCCYRPLSRDPLWRYQPRYLVRQTPALTNGYVTFGSCNNLGKLTDEVLATWGKILAQVPHSKLLIEGKNLDKADFSTSYRQRCTSLGIPGDRLILEGQDTANQYLTYHRIDIALDPFPLTGGTTSFDVLWMGVPLVSMTGDSFKSRMGVGILTHLGRTEWLASGTSEYVEIAHNLAQDVAALSQIRLQLREQVENSPLMREDVFRKHFSDALRLFWMQRLARHHHANDENAQFQAIAEWVGAMPPEWDGAPPLGVGTEPGHRLSLQQAHELLQRLVEQARHQKTSSTPHATPTVSGRWAQVTYLAEQLLCAHPHDPVALACLAEVEHAYGHTDFAVTYLRYATAHMG